MSRLSLKNNSYTIANNMKFSPAIEKYGDGFIIAYCTASLQISIVKTDKYYQTIGSVYLLNGNTNEYYPTISQLSNKSYAICYNK